MRGVDKRGPALYAVNELALGEQKLGQKRTILTGDSRDEGYFRHRVCSGYVIAGAEG